MLSWQGKNVLLLLLLLGFEADGRASLLRLMTCQQKPCVPWAHTALLHSHCSLRLRFCSLKDTMVPRFCPKAFLLYCDFNLINTNKSANTQYWEITHLCFCKTFHVRFWVRKNPLRRWKSIKLVSKPWMLTPWREKNKEVKVTSSTNSSNFAMSTLVHKT
jgi:hypothetical protein